MFFLLAIMFNPLFLYWLWNHLSWNLFIRPRGILQMLKWGNWPGKHIGIVLSFMLYPNKDLSWSLKVQRSSLDWWCHFLVGRCCWMRSTTLSCLLILGLKRCMLYYLPEYSGHTWEFLVSKSVSLVRFVNMLRILHKHPQDCWNCYPLLIENLDLGLWISSLGYHLVLMVVMPFLPVLIVWQSTLFWLYVLEGQGVKCQTSCTVVFLGYCQTVWLAWQYGPWYKTTIHCRVLDWTFTHPWILYNL